MDEGKNREPDFNGNHPCINKMEIKQQIPHKRVSNYIVNLFMKIVNCRQSYKSKFIGEKSQLLNDHAVANPIHSRFFTITVKT